jgi:preprotein translocase subunit SecD
MQYRPKLWIGTLIALLLTGFEIGFQPIRVIPREQGGVATMEFDLGQAAGTDEAALTTKADELRGKLVKAAAKDPKWLTETRFVSDRLLRVSTLVLPGLTEQNRAEDQNAILSELKKEFPKVKLAPALTESAAGEKPAATLGPIGLYVPRPHVNLGLDLQGGAHVVLQAMPSTEMTFTAPEDRPFVGPGEAAKPATEAAEPKAGEAKAEEKAAETPVKAGEKATETAPKAEEKAGKAAETLPKTEEKATESAPKAEDKTGKAAETAPKAEETKATKAAEATTAAWKPTETKDSLERQLYDLLVAQGASGVEVKVVAANLIRIYTRATGEAQADTQRGAVRDWLKQRYRGIKIEDRASSVFVGKDTADKAKHIVDLRLYSMTEIKEPIVQKQGNDRIIVELPGVTEQKRVTELLKTTAQLEFRLVPKRYTSAGTTEEDYSTWKDSQTGLSNVSEAAVLAQSEVMFRGRDLKDNASVEPEPEGKGWEVRFELKENQKQAFAKFTREHVGWIMAIVLDGQTRMAPVIRSEIPGLGVISGSMDTRQASDLKLLLNAGALPVPLEIVENRQVSATLGANAVRQAVEAGILGFIIVAIFMVMYYRLPGLLADMALTLYIVLMLALLSNWSPLQTTLTLPGIAGIILSIGMAVDANVIIFERLREEMRTRTTTRAAVEAGFHRAWPAILDSNITTVIGGAALYFFGTSSVKSFAVTLLLGVATHLFTAVTASRWLVNIIARTRLGENRALFGVEPIRTPAVSPAGGSE